MAWRRPVPDVEERKAFKTKVFRTVPKAEPFHPFNRSFHNNQKGEFVMNSIVWLVGAVVIVIAVLNLVGFA